MIKKRWGYALLGAVVATSLVGISKSGFAKEDQKSNRAQDTAYVNVSVATIWGEPDNLRDIDEPSAAEVVDPWRWTESMTLDDKLWLVGKLETQAVYGQKVTVLEEDGEWVKVAVDGQSTPKEELGYPGWMPKRQLTENPTLAYMDHQPDGYVTAPTANLYNDWGLEQEYLEVSYNTILPVLHEGEGRALLLTPDDGAKWVDSDDVNVYENEEAIPAPEAEDLIEDGKQFLGLPYLWAGVSGFGFDCSGFTHSLYKAHGIEIPRDSGDQAKAGTFVEREDWQTGDLLFFARDGGTGTVHHVGMYIGDGEMIHAPNSAKTVEIVNVNDFDYTNGYHSARRYLED
ncbi:C40 family peptidase [Shouchella shacheensis]|uniref:C40 family peptidase n=1 Tax=Shouchella shacheensis TaxID=1649580 RepID=UPI0007400966|nr:C40 family peptidase [Shouchella shacheensis]